MYQQAINAISAWLQDGKLKYLQNKTIEKPYSNPTSWELFEERFVKFLDFIMENHLFFDCK